MKKGYQARAWLVGLYISMSWTHVSASENFLDFVTQLNETPRSSFWMEYQSYDDDSTDFYMDLSTYLTPTNKLSFGIGESQLHDVNQSIDTLNYNIQFSHQTAGNIDVGIGYSYWGDDNELWTETLELFLTIHSDDFSLRLQPRYSTLNIYTVPILGERRLHESDSKGWELSFSYYGIKSWVINISGTDYQYDADLTKLNTLLAQLIFSNSALLLSDNFLEKSTTAQIKKQFTYFDIGLIFSRSVSAIDHSEIDSAAINVEWFVNKDYSVFLETGNTVPESGGPSKYVTAGFNVLF